jgi:hypothetical protein
MLLARALDDRMHVVSPIFALLPFPVAEKPLQSVEIACIFSDRRVGRLLEYARLRLVDDDFRDERETKAKREFADQSAANAIDRPNARAEQAYGV